MVEADGGVASAAPEVAAGADVGSALVSTGPFVLGGGLVTEVAVVVVD
jgi:hypothetical protein